MHPTSRSDLRSSPASGPSGPSWQLQLGGLGWILTAVFFLGQLVAQTAWPAFSLWDNHVSDLGNTACGPWMAQEYICSPLHAVMNASLVLSGVLLLVGLVLTYRAWPRRRLTTWGLGCLGVAGLCTVIVGLNPENVNLRLHLVGALNIPTANIALLLLGLACWGSQRRIATLSLVLSAIGWLGLPVGILLLVMTGHGGGLAERLALYPVFVWAIVLGIVFVRSPGRDADQSRSGNQIGDAPVSVSA